MFEIVKFVLSETSRKAYTLNYDCLKNIRLPNNKCTLLPLFGPSTALLSRIFSLEFNKTQVPSSPTILQFVWHSPPPSQLNCLTTIML